MAGQRGDPATTANNKNTYTLIARMKTLAMGPVTGVQTSGSSWQRCVCQQKNRAEFNPGKRPRTRTSQRLWLYRMRWAASCCTFWQSRALHRKTGSRAWQGQKACLRPVVGLSDSTLAETFSEHAESLQLQGQRLCFHSG